jgi:hypothetical protein
MERGKLFRTVMVAALISVLGRYQARAELVELPLDCAGTYDIDNPYWTSDFDLGVTFTEIFHVYIDWAGELTGGLATPFPGPGDPFPIDAGALASLGSNPYFRSADVWGGEATYPDPEAFDLILEFQLPGPSTWSDLLDGAGTITIEYDELNITGSYVEHGTLLLNEATLLVDGTVVPEPVTLLFLGIGALWIRAGCRRPQGRA